MVKNLDDGCLSDRASFEVLHSVLAGQGDGFDLGDGAVVATCNLAFLHVGARGKVDHVAYEDFDRHIASVTLIDPLFNFLEAAALGDIEHEKAGSASVHILVDVLVVALPPWHIKVHDFVLISVVDVVSRFDVQLCRLLVFDDSA